MVGQEKEKLFKRTKESLVINGEEYNFEFCWKGIVEMENLGVDFERITRIKNMQQSLKEFLKKLNIILYGALYKNHKLSLSECETLADAILKEYALDQIYFMMIGLYFAVFSGGEKQIPLAEETAEALKAELEKLEKIAKELQEQTKKTTTETQKKA